MFHLFSRLKDLVDERDRYKFERDKYRRELHESREILRQVLNGEITKKEVFERGIDEI